MMNLSFFHLVLQKTGVSPNPFKLKMKNSPIIEKLQVGASYNIGIFWEEHSQLL